MKVKPPFLLSNPFYSYRTIEGSGSLSLDSYSVFFVYMGGLSLINNEGSQATLSSGQYLEYAAKGDFVYKCAPGSIVVLVQAKELTRGGFVFDSNYIVKDLDGDGYIVSKPWGREVWLTGAKPSHGVVLKYIEVEASTKTSLQVHMQKYESNFIAGGKAIFRYSDTEFKGKDCSYPLNEEVIDTPTVIDVSPLTIHQVEAVTRITLIEASTCHLDDVIRLIDDTGRSDGRIESEHLTGGPHGN